MAQSRQERISPMLYDWLFTDELGITLDIGRFIVPAQDSRTIGSRMGKYRLNDGRTIVGRTETFREVDSRPIVFAGIPYNFAKELENRVGARFRIRDCWGDYMWVVLDSMTSAPIHSMAWARTEQLYNITLNFSQVNPG